MWPVARGLWPLPAYLAQPSPAQPNCCCCCCCCGSSPLLCRHTPRPTSYPPAATTTCYTMELSTIPGQSHPRLGSAGSINAVPSAGRGRRSQPWRLLFQAHKPRKPALALPALRKGQTYTQSRIRLRVMLAASLNETLTEAARSSAPSALCRRSCTLGSPGRFSPLPGRGLPYERGRTTMRSTGRSTNVTRRSEGTTDRAHTSRDGAAAQQAC